MNITPKKDEELISFFIDNQKKFFLTALAITRNPQLAEEVINETFILFYTKQASLKNKLYFKTWITRILINECYRILKQEKAKAVSIDDLKDMDTLTFDNDEWNFFEMIDCLCRDEREVVTLRYFNELSLQEIASALRKPLSTIKSCLYRALEKLKKEWK